jgi:hypothetical protein
MAADFFVVPTVTYRLLFVLVLLAYDRRRVMHIAVTDHPTSAWTAQHVLEVTTDDSRVDLELQGTTQLFTLESPSSRTWWPFGLARHPACGRRRSFVFRVTPSPDVHARLAQSSRYQFPPPWGRASTNGNWIKMPSRLRSRSVAHWLWTMRIWSCSRARGAGWPSWPTIGQRHISPKEQIRVMEDWTPVSRLRPLPPHRKQQPAALAAVIETLRLSRSPRSSQRSVRLLTRRLLSAAVGWHQLSECGGKASESIEAKQPSARSPFRRQP